MIEIIPANQRHYADFGWLRTFWLFSFADYYDPKNLQFGSLRVFNDDVVQPGRGFPMHPHQEMEIITVVLSGAITHKDSMGNETVIKANEVQRLSAGIGLSHSEFNLGQAPVHFYQIWFYPDVKGQKPAYQQKSFKPEQWLNQLCPLASPYQEHKEAVQFSADAALYRCQLEKTAAVEYETEDTRRVFVYLTAGQILINQSILTTKDQARIDLENNLIIEATQEADFILIDVPSCQGFGYDAVTLQGSRA